MTIAPTFPMPPGTAQDDYWVIKPQGIEWQFLIAKMIKKDMVNVDQAKIPVLVFTMETGENYWLLSRLFLSVQSLSKYTGLGEKELNDSPLIELTVNDRPDLPKPTVSDWGEA